MTDVSSEKFETINYDLNDSKFLELKNCLTKELKERFDCTDFEQIVEYILKSVFEKKETKENMIKDTKDMFKDKTEELFDFLWNSTNKIYSTNNNDVLDEIINKKPSAKPQPSQDKKNTRERSRDKTSEEKPPNKVKKTHPRGGFGFPPFQMRGFPYPPRGMFRVKRAMPKNPPANKPATNTNDNNNANKKEESEVKNNPQQQEQEKGPKEEHTETDNKEGEAHKKKIRCKNWPQCKDPNCEYSHPTEACPYFPSCAYGTRCMYIHPNIPCKYGYYCTRTGCNYSHPAGWNPGIYQIPFHIPNKKYTKKQTQENTQ